MGRPVEEDYLFDNVGDFVGTLAADESNTIRIGDISNGNGAGWLECFIGGIYNNFQPVGGTVVQVTLDRTNDHLGWDYGTTQSRSGSVQRTAPQRRNASFQPPPRSMAKLAKLRSWKQRSLSNKNK